MKQVYLYGIILYFIFLLYICFIIKKKRNILLWLLLGLVVINLCFPLVLRILYNSYKGILLVYSIFIFDILISVTLLMAYLYKFFHKKE